MVIDSRQRALEKLAYRYWIKNKNRTAHENWKLAEKLLDYIDKKLKKECK
jgi:hypothetical protein